MSDLFRKVESALAEFVRTNTKNCAATNALGDLYLGVCPTHLKTEKERGTGAQLTRVIIYDNHVSEIISLTDMARYVAAELAAEVTA